MEVAQQASTADLTQVEDFAPRSQSQKAHGAPEDHDLTNSAHVTNGFVHEHNHSFYWQASQDQVPSPEAPLRIITKSPTSTSSGKSFTRPDTSSFDSARLSSTRDALVFSEHLTTTNSTRSISVPTKDYDIKSSGRRESDEFARPRPVVRKARGPAERIQRAVLRSNTFDVVRGFVTAFAHVNWRPSRKEDGVDDKARQDARRSRVWIHIHLSCLEDRLKAATRSSHLSNQKFLPRGLLEELVTQSSVERELSRWKHIPSKFIRTWKRPYSIPIETGESHSDKFQLRSRSTSELLRQGGDKTYRKIFAILTFITRPTSIWLFVEEGICDADLPLIKASGANGPQHCFELRGRQAMKTLRRCKDWENALVNKFVEHQWVFLAPSFETSDGNVIPHQDFHADKILPFTCWKKTPERGGFGQVYKAYIHSDHHTFDNTQVPNGVVAIKKLLSKHQNTSQNEEAFLKESEILRNMSKERHTHEHLINLLATFSQSGQYYLIFPWAEADLEYYWQYIRPDPPTQDKSMEMWLIEQCQGLAEGLARVHRYTTLSNSTMLSQIQRPRSLSKDISSSAGSLNLIGRHGDIKPKNILWFPDRTSNSGHGILKITDFGIARFTPENKAQKREKGLIPNSLTYRSPECDLLDEEVSAQCDVWALGCVYLVFATWFFGGWGAVTSFSERRDAPDEFWHGLPTDSFFSVIRNESGVAKAKVKDTVTQHISKLHSHIACTEAFRNLIDLVRYEMLIVQKKIEATAATPASGGLAVPGRELARRKSSGHIASDLGSIMSNCQAGSPNATQTSSPSDDGD